MALPFYPPNTTYRTVAMDQYGVEMCGSHVGCKKGLTWTAHKKGKIVAGTIHWDRADMVMYRKGARELYKFLALAFNKSWQREPRWRRIPLTNMWAYNEVERTLHFRLRKEWFQGDRELTWRLFSQLKDPPSNISSTDHGIQMWMWRGGYNLSRRQVMKSR